MSLKAHLIDLFSNTRALLEILGTGVTGSFAFVAATDKITRAAGSFITDGFLVGDRVITDAPDAANKGYFTITALTALEMTVDGALVDAAASTRKITRAKSCRVYPTKLPQNPQYPCAVVTTISGFRDHTLRGASGLANPRVQLDCHGQTDSALTDNATGLVPAFKALLVPGRAPSYSGTRKGVRIESVVLVNERDFYEDEPKNPRIALDFKIWHRDAI